MTTESARDRVFAASRMSALKIATIAHEGQFDAAGNPCIWHPIAVNEIVEMWRLSDDACRAALLHDVLEDTDLTDEDLLTLGQSEGTLALVIALSRPRDETYQQFIIWLAQCPLEEARIIKLADLIHNSSPDRVGQLPPERQTITKRYHKAAKRLLATLGSEWQQKIVHTAKTYGVDWTDALRSFVNTKGACGDADDKLF